MPRLCAVALSLALGLGAAACGDDAPSVAPSTTTSPPAPSAPAPPEPTGGDTAPSTAPTGTSEQSEPTGFTVEVATINVLHGNPAASGCAPETDNCLAPTRLGLIWDMLERDTGCPEIIALQEIDQRWFDLIGERLPDLCQGRHVALAENVNGVSEEMILTTLPVIDNRRVTLAGGPIWGGQWAQLDAGDGLVVDVFATHFASSAFNLPCAENPLDPCAPRCPGDMSMGDCHPVQTLEHLAELADPESLQLVIGDLNATRDEPRIRTLLDAGFVDTHVLAGNTECPEDGGRGCTSGVGGDTPLDGLDVADQTLRRRIDFVLARPPAGCTIRVDRPDGAGADHDGDGTVTGIWADAALTEPVEGLHWASDHAGIQADIGLTCA